VLKVAADPEDVALVRAGAARSPVEVAVTVPDDARMGLVTRELEVGRGERGHRPAGGHLEDRAGGIGRDRAAACGRAVEVAVRPEDEPGIRLAPVGAREGMYG